MPRVEPEAATLHPVVAPAGGSRLHIAGIALVLVSVAIIVAVLIGCQAEGGWYCTTYGHPHPEIFKKIYELHGGEYGDLIFGSAQAVLIVTLVAFPSTRRALQRRHYCLWHKQGGLWHWAVLIVLPFLVFCGGLLNRIRGGWLGDEGIVMMASSLGDFISRISLSAGTLVLVTILSGGNLSLGLIYFFFMWWAEMLGWGCYFNMAHGPPPPPNSHGDCAGLDGSPAAGGKDRRGMYDWLLGTAVASWPHARRLRRDWAGMFLRGLNWLGPPGLATAVGGYGTAVIACGTCLPALYNADTWFDDSGSWITKKPFDFDTGSPLGEFVWGMFAWTAVISSFLGQRQSPNDGAQQTTGYVRARGTPSPVENGGIQDNGADITRLRRPSAAVVTVRGTRHSGLQQGLLQETTPDEIETGAGQRWRTVLCRGWKSLRDPDSTIPQRLVSLVERLMWTAGVVQSCCSLCIIIWVSLENGHGIALIAVALFLCLVMLAIFAVSRTDCARHADVAFQR